MFGMTVHASVDQRQQFQQLGVQEGIAFDGNRCVRTGVTAPAFSYCGGLRGNERMVTLSFASWNPAGRVAAAGGEAETGGVSPLSQALSARTWTIGWCQHARSADA